MYQSLLKLATDVQLVLGIYLIGAYVSIVQFARKFISLYRQPFVRSSNASCSSPIASRFSFAEKVAVVTGGTSGIGHETVKKLHNIGYTVIVGSNCSTQEPVDGVEYVHMDLSSPSSIMTFADLIREKHQEIDLLINCAGVMFVPLQYTELGANLEFSINYLGHFMLTLLLEELLVTSTKTRIINFTSATRYISDGDFSEKGVRPSKRDYKPYESYARSKHALVLLTYKLQRLWKDKNVVLIAYDPGTVNTPMFRRASFLARIFFMTLGKVFLRAPEEAAQDLIKLINISPPLFKCYKGWTGKFVNTSSEAYGLNAQDELWKRSLELTGMENCGH